MATQYPSDFPHPTIAGFGINVASGVIRSDMSMHQQQRRLYKTMPHTFSLRFVLSTEQWFDWQRWVTDNGFKWFEMDLPSMYAGRTFECSSPLLVRLISDVQVTAITRDHFEVLVTAESAPSVPATVPRQTGGWIVAGLPATPSSLDVIVAETGGGISPAANTITGGDPGWTAA